MPRDVFMVMAIGPQLRSQIEAGSSEAFFRGLVCTAALWFDRAGTHIDVRASVGHVNCVAGSDPAARALLAAAMDLCRLLELSPQGREALLNFHLHPVFQEAKGE